MAGYMGQRGARQTREQLILAVLGRYAPGEKLPPEATAARELGVSRNTLREALEEMRLRGLVQRIWGVGTFMSERAGDIDYTLSDLVSITQLIESAGRACQMESTFIGTCEPPERVAKALGTASDEQCWHTQRRYFADGQPVVWVDEYMRTVIEGQQTDPGQVGTDIQAYYREQLGIPLASAEVRLHPAQADAQQAELLDIQPGGLLLRTESVMIADSGAKVAFTEAWTRSDILSVKIIRRPPVTR